MRLAREVTHEMGRPWSRGMIAALETGHRDVDLDEVFALAKALDMPLRWFTEDPVDVFNIPGSLKVAVAA